MIKRRAAAVAAAMIFSASNAHAAAEQPPARTSNVTANPNLPFVANAGQLDPRVAFHARTFAGGVFALRSGELIYSLPAPRTKSGASDHKGWVLKESFVDGRAIPSAGERSQTRVSVLTPQRSHAADAVDSVRFGEVWAGVDVEIHARGDNIEKVFTLAPGADSSAIRLKIDGASLSLAPDGSLVAATGHGPLSFAAPFAYQERGSRREAVAVRYRLEGDRYGFELGAFDRSRALVIDPIIQSTYIGGSGSTFLREGPTDIAVHPVSGDVYVAGATDSADLPGVAGGAAPALAGNSSGFIARFSADLQTLEQATFFGGQADEVIHSIVVTNTDVYVSGQSAAGALPAGTTAGAQPTDPNSGSDFNGFIARLPLSLTSVTASTFLGGTTNHPTQIFDSVLHDNGSLYVCGQTASGSLPNATGGFDAANSPANRSAFVTRVAPDLTAFQQTTYFADGGFSAGAYTRCTALAVISGSGDLVIGGQTTFGSATPPNTAGGLLSTTTGAWLARLNDALTQNSQSTWLAGVASASSEPRVAGLRIHPGNGDLYVLADRVRTGSPLPANATTGGGQDTCTGTHTCLLVARISPTLTTLVAGTFYGNANSDTLIPRAFDHLTIDPASGDVFVVSDGVPSLPNTAGGIQPAPLGGGTPGIMVRIRGDLGQIVQASYLSGAGTSGTSPYAAVVHPGVGHLYVVGHTGSASFPQTSGGAQAAIGGGAGDGFVSRITLDLLGAASPGVLQFSPAAYTTVEGNTFVQVSVTRSGGADGAASVSYATSNGTASAGSDYTAASGTLNWAAGDGAAKTIDVPILADATDEADETITLALTNATGATLGSQTTATITITDDDAAAAQPGVVQFNAAAYSANENGGSVTLTLTRTGGADGAISVNVASGGGSAAAGSDYTALTQTVSWADGDATAKTVSMLIANDSADEPDETVNVALSNAAGGATLGAISSATVTIVDDDVASSPPPPVSSQSSSVSGSYGGGAMGWVTLFAGLVLAALVRVRAHRLPSSPRKGGPIFDPRVKTKMGPRVRGGDGKSGRQPGRVRGRDDKGRRRPRLIRGDDDILSIRGAGGLVAAALLFAAPLAAADDASGWFVGVRGGIARSTLDEADLERALAAHGHTVAVSLDDQEPMWTLFGGYRWASGLGVEGGFIDLGEYDVTIQGVSPNAAALLDDAQSSLADAGKGGVAALSWRWSITDRLSITPRLGAYYWESERTLTSGGQRVERTENGVNLMGGIGLGWMISPSWSLALGWDAYDAGGRNDVRAYSAAVEYRFGR